MPTRGELGLGVHAFIEELARRCVNYSSETKTGGGAVNSGLNAAISTHRTAKCFLLFTASPLLTVGEPGILQRCSNVRFETNIL